MKWEPKKLNSRLMGSYFSEIGVKTTPSRQPVVKASWIDSGVYINAICADAAGKQLEIEILTKAKVVVDDIKQSIHEGEINVAVSRGEVERDYIHAMIGGVVTGINPGRESDDEITVFDSTGLAIEDIVGRLFTIYENAVKTGKGVEIEFF